MRTTGLAMLLAGMTATALAAPVTFVNINPDNEGPVAGQAGVTSACPDPCASGRNGGRVNRMAAVPGNASLYFAASETAGLFKTTDGGQSWIHVDGHIPVATWGVAVAPGGQRVFATSFYDGRVSPLTGVEVSKDGSATWARVAMTAPATCSANRAKQPSGFGVTLRPGGSEVFAGTNCGLARSGDNGDSWSQFDPTPADGVTNSVWDVVALAGGRTYACGDDGLLVSTDGQSGTWRSLNQPNPFPGGFCSLAVSPDDPNVVFVAFGNPRTFGDLFSVGCCNFAPNQGPQFYEGRLDAALTSVTWSQLPYPDDIGDSDPNVVVKKGRIPFVVTNPRTTGFDLWLGDGSLYRVPCSASTTPSCPTDTTQWSGSFTDHPGGQLQNAHGDSGHLVFDPTQSVDACPTLYSSDGGIHSNSLTSSPACQAPAFRGANVGLHAFLLWDMAGVERPGEETEEIYVGLQDNGLYYAGNAGIGTPSAPSWTHGIGADLYDLEADADRVVASTGGRELLVGDPGFQNVTVVAQNGFGNRDVDIPEFIAAAGPDEYMFAISASSTFTVPSTTLPVGVRDTTNITANPLGMPLGIWPVTAQPPCHIRVGVGPAGPRPYVLAGTCLWMRTDFTADQLWTLDATNNWIQILPPPRNTGDPVAAAAGFGLIAVDPVDPDRLYASVVRDGPPRLMRSIDGGAHWATDEGLTALMSANGAFVDYPVPAGDGLFPFLEPLMVTFDPHDANILVAGASYAGVFLSNDAGQHWTRLTPEPFTPGTPTLPQLPRPLFAHFDHDKADAVRIYLGTGRGVWRVDLASNDLSVDKSDSPDPVVTGSDLTYTLQVGNAGPTASGAVTLTDVLPSTVAFQSLAAPAGWSCTTPAVGTTGSVSCARAELAGGATDTFTLVGRVGCSVADGTPLVNAATIATPLPDPVTGNNAAMTTTIASNPPPVITCPDDIEIECAGHCGTPADDPQLVPFFAGVTVTDNCPGVTLVNDAPSCFDLGSTTVTFTATDSAGASASCTAIVSVVDTTPPEISVTLSRDVLWPPNHKLAEILATVEVTDVCDPHPTFVLTSITSNEPDNGLGDGDTAGDIQEAQLGTADTAFKLRSERSGQGSGRTYTIVYTASDESGNTAQATVHVTVPHDQAGHANGGSGFNALGTGFGAKAQSFQLVVVSTPSFDARSVDPQTGQVGTVAMLIDATQNRLADANGDGRLDLILSFPVPARRQSFVDVPAFRYGTTTGSFYLVPDIFALGHPLVTPR
ncbi:MAG TPA: HYR domain-containing protein [Candidatus Polarisedimenticolaceae bacterium]|nr:HYR domain-containing protein [Candidatus Polarisedimenticolaceae bacterium]